MAESHSERELTSTLHLGLRGVVSNSPADLLSQLLAGSVPEDRAAIEAVMAGDGNSCMVVIHRGPAKGSRFLIQAEGATIGRASESAIFLDDVTVSRKHASILKSTKREPGESGFTFVDHGSLNGSYINNVSVAESELHTGDEIQIGKFHLLFIGADVTTGEK